MRLRAAACAVLAGVVIACGGPERADPAERAAARATAEAEPERVEPARLPNRAGSVRFAVIGDSGRGDRRQYDTAATMAAWHATFPFDFVLMLGDNIYDHGTPEDYAQRFERPYKPLLDAGVTFHASLGNHDPPGQEHYPPFNMRGRRYYTFERTDRSVPLVSNDVLFMAIDTVNLTGEQLRWIDEELDESDADWKITFFHHPLYTSGRYQFGASRLRAALEPLLVEHGVEVSLSGHEHFYERVRPQRGVHYFTSGAGGALRVGDLRESEWTAAGFDADTHFLLMEIAGDMLHFLAVSRTGEVVDWGIVERRS